MKTSEHLTTTLVRSKRWDKSWGSSFGELRLAGGAVGRRLTPARVRGDSLESERAPHT